MPFTIYHSLFNSMHSSFLSKPSTYTTHNAARQPFIRRFGCVMVVAVNIASNRDEERATDATPPDFCIPNTVSPVNRL